MGFSKTIKEFLKSVFKSRAGAALPMIVLAGSLVAAGGLLLFQSGDMIFMTSKAKSERTIINNVVQDIETALASRSECTAAMATFNQIGSYTRGLQIAGGDITVTWPVGGIGALPLVPNGFFPAGNPLSDVRRFTLTFNINNNRVRGNRNVRHDLYIQEFTTNVDVGAGGTEQSCMAFQPSGAENSVNLFCERIGGTLNNDGSCNLDAGAPGAPGMKDF